MSSWPEKAIFSCSLYLSGAAPAVGGDWDNAFSAGASCAALAYLSEVEVRAAIENGFPEDLHAFCTPEQPFDCGDYTPFLAGLGRMTAGDDGFYCAVQR